MQTKSNWPNKVVLLRTIFMTIEILNAWNCVFAMIPFFQCRLWECVPYRFPCNRRIQSSIYEQHYRGAVIIIIIIENSCGSLVEAEPHVNSWKCESYTHSHTRTHSLTHTHSHTPTHTHTYPPTHTFWTWNIHVYLSSCACQYAKHPKTAVLCRIHIQHWCNVFLSPSDERKDKRERNRPGQK